jgi:hypothetical protein
MRIALNGRARRCPARDGEISWTQAYERRMRRFNLEIISVAIIALLIVIRFISIDWWIFQK